MPRENASQLPGQQPRPTFLSAWAIRCVETTFIASFTLGAAAPPDIPSHMGHPGEKRRGGNGMALKLTTPRGAHYSITAGALRLPAEPTHHSHTTPRGSNGREACRVATGRQGQCSGASSRWLDPPWGPYPFARPFRGRASLTRGYKVVRPLRGRQPLAIFYCSRQRNFNTMAAIFSSARSPARKYAKIRKT